MWYNGGCPFLRYSLSLELWHSCIAFAWNFDITLCLQFDTFNLSPRETWYLHILTYSMAQSTSWEANWFAASQEIPCITRNPKVHYCTHICPPPVPILSQINPVHDPTSHFLKIRLNIIPHLFWVFQVVSFLRVFPPKPYIHLSSPPHVLYAPQISFSIWLPE